MGTPNPLYPPERFEGSGGTGGSSFDPCLLAGAGSKGLISQADSITYAQTGKMPCLEECTRTVSKAFSICATDR